MKKINALFSLSHWEKWWKALKEILAMEVWDWCGEGVSLMTPHICWKKKRPQSHARDLWSLNMYPKEK